MKIKIVLVTLLVLILVGLGTFLGVIYSGAFDVAATSGHSAFTKWVATTVVDNSVKKHAADLSAPAWFASDDPSQGFKSYDQHCRGCHGAPGITRGDVPKGMEPPPPEMTDAAKDWGPKELYWIASHGIKMSGMPPFNKVFSEEERWHLVAFLKKLPNMTSQRYADLKGMEGEDSGHPGH